MGGRMSGSSGHRRRPRRPYRALTAVIALCALLGSACSAEPGPSPDSGAAATSYQDPPRCRRTLVGVAHPDDDLFFFNPEITRTIRARCPVDIVYLTAGDDALKVRLKALEYVDRREYGVRSAYAVMADAADVWKQSDLQADGVRVRSFLLAGRASGAAVRLTFLDLHDGLPRGQEADSVLKLFDGSKRSVNGFLGGVSYSEERLLGVLSALVRSSRAERLLTMDYDNASFAFGLGGGVDHSDHGIAARYFRWTGYALGVPVTSYLAYTMSTLKVNLTPGQAAEKTDVARWYIAKRTCRATGRCANVPPYRGPLHKDWDLWVHRQYTQVHRTPRPGEVLGDIGRTTYATGRDPAQCLDAAEGSSAGRKVRIHRCDGSAAQQWAMRHNGTIGLRHEPDSCLTAIGQEVGLEPCHGDGPSQKWTRVPWRSPTWKRTAWRIEDSGHRCLYQDDRELPARWDDRDRPSPRLTLSDCSGPVRPEQYWEWGE
ncbi:MULTISPECIES: ricin-type beta-trefoil lectin domain protein [unclassified Streptomyces]|uniref:ricin-type beta-trefoil lectin domain protein n=1 Tax=unclassified Streptomyces TaxID=2593676 RepID=UPI0036F13A75